MPTNLTAKTVPEQGFGIRFESIGGLGANLAGKLLAEAGVLQMGLNGAQFSSYGSEKKGSPVTTYIRFVPADARLRVSEPITEPDAIAVFHEAMLRDPSVYAGVKQGGVLIVNTSRTPEDIWRQTGLSGVTIVTVNATAIAIEERTRANTAMLGSLCGAVGFLDPDAVKKSITDQFGRKYQDLVEANVRTFERGFAEIHSQTFVNAPDKTENVAVAAKHVAASNLIGGVIAQAGNMSWKDLSGSRQGFLPEFDKDKCVNCAACDQVCPDYCFVWEPRTDEKGRTFQFLAGIDYQFCKGCLKCVAVCPVDALKGIREEENYAVANRVAHCW